MTDWRCIAANGQTVRIVASTETKAAWSASKLLGSVIVRVEKTTMKIKTGKRIRNLRDLERAALGRKSLVSVPGWGFARPIPAAFVWNMPACRVALLIDRGIYVYKSGWSKP